MNLPAIHTADFIVNIVQVEQELFIKVSRRNGQEVVCTAIADDVDVYDPLAEGTVLEVVFI